MKDSRAIMDLCQSWLPEYTEEYIPDLVHDFIWDNWEKLKEILGEIRNVNLEKKWNKIIGKDKESVVNG